ncbi:MAG: serine hydrolase [Caldilineaceae bacterium]
MIEIGKKLIALPLVALLLLSSCQTPSPTTAGIPARDGRWHLSVESYADDARLAALDQAITDSYPTINSMVIVRDGYIIFEAYSNGTDAETQHAIFSITKSVLSMLIGIAIDQGLLEGVNQTVGDFLVKGEASEETDSVTLEALLTMTAGLDDPIAFPAIRGCLATSAEWRPCVAEVVQAQPAPAQFFYSESAGIAFAHSSDVSGGSTLDFAEETLFRAAGDRTAPGKRTLKGTTGAVTACA